MTLENTLINSIASDVSSDVSEDHRKYDVCVDARDLLCPHPLLKAKLALEPLSSGAIVQVRATDPSSVIDFKVFTQQTSNQLLDWYQTKDDLYVFYIQKSA